MAKQLIQCSFVLLSVKVNDWRSGWGVHFFTTSRFVDFNHNQYFLFFGLVFHFGQEVRWTSFARSRPICTDNIRQVDVIKCEALRHARSWQKFLFSGNISTRAQFPYFNSMFALCFKVISCLVSCPYHRVWYSFFFLLNFRIRTFCLENIFEGFIYFKFYSLLINIYMYTFFSPLKF